MMGNTGTITVWNKLTMSSFMRMIRSEREQYPSFINPPAGGL